MLEIGVGCSNSLLVKLHGRKCTRTEKVKSHGTRQEQKKGKPRGTKSSTPGEVTWNLLAVGICTSFMWSLSWRSG